MADKDAIKLPIVYIGAEDVPVALANQFIIQHEQNEFILTFGQITPPILLGNDEQRLEQAKNIAYVPVKVVGRFTFTRQRLSELVDVLQRHLRKYDAEGEKSK